MAKFTLYHADGCHLCEQAHDLLLQQLEVKHIELVDIVSSETLIEKYQIKIPVVVDKNNKELFWPFDALKLREFIN